MFSALAFRPPSATTENARENKMKTTLLWLAILTATSTLYGQDQATTPEVPPVITTDRPAITDASTVVPSGYVLFENGFETTGDQRQNSFEMSQAIGSYAQQVRAERCALTACAGHLWIRLRCSTGFHVDFLFRPRT